LNLAAFLLIYPWEAFSIVRVFAGSENPYSMPIPTEIVGSLPRPACKMTKLSH
jgi:hypothetical protein